MTYGRGKIVAMSSSSRVWKTMLTRPAAAFSSSIEARYSLMPISPATSLRILPWSDRSGMYSETVIRDPPPRMASVSANTARIFSSCVGSAIRARKASTPPSWHHCGNRTNRVLLVAA